MCMTVVVMRMLMRVSLRMVTSLLQLACDRIAEFLDSRLESLLGSLGWVIFHINRLVLK